MSQDQENKLFVYQKVLQNIRCLKFRSRSWMGKFYRKYTVGDSTDCLFEIFNGIRFSNKSW